jgi:ABC-type nitrate/sulfonate/bicarbonate transport system permease component
VTRGWRLLMPVAAVGGVFVLWDIAIRLFDVHPYVVPSPGDAFRSILDDWDTLSGLTWTTLKETVIGFVVGAVTGFAIAVLMSRWSLVRRLLYPVLIASQAIPVVAIAAPLVIVLGFGLAPKIAIVAFIVFFPVVVNVLDGLASVDRDLLNLARIMDGRPIRVLLVLELPATLTPLFSALKLGATYAVTGAVLGEWTASLTPGLGNYLLVQNSRLNTDAVYGAVLLLAAIGIGGFLVVTAVERLATPWRTRATPPRWWRRPTLIVRSAGRDAVSGDVSAQQRGGAR